MSRWPAFTYGGTAGARLHEGRTMDEWNRNRPVQAEHMDFRQDAVERERKRRERDERRKKSLDDRLDLGIGGDVSRLRSGGCHPAAGKPLRQAAPLGSAERPRLAMMPRQIIDFSRFLNRMMEEVLAARVRLLNIF